MVYKQTTIRTLKTQNLNPHNKLDESVAATRLFIFDHHADLFFSGLDHKTESPTKSESNLDKKYD